MELYYVIIMEFMVVEVCTCGNTYQMPRVLCPTTCLYDACLYSRSSPIKGSKHVMIATLWGLWHIQPFILLCNTAAQYVENDTIHRDSKNGLLCVRCSKELQ